VREQNGKYARNGRKKDLFGVGLYLLEQDSVNGREMEYCIWEQDGVSGGEMEYVGARWCE
jgi:hypothetical protein